LKTGLQRVLDLVAALPRALEGDLLGVAAGAQDPEDLAAAHDIETRALLDEDAQEREVAVRLDGVADMRLHLGERVAEASIVAEERRAAIHVGRRPDRFRDARERNGLRMEPSPASHKIIHAGRIAGCLVTGEACGTRGGTRTCGGGVRTPIRTLGRSPGGRHRRAASPVAGLRHLNRHGLAASWPSGAGLRRRRWRMGAVAVLVGPVVAGTPDAGG
jgi:hypothetical protein